MRQVRIWGAACAIAIVLGLGATDPSIAGEVRVIHYGGSSGKAMRDAFFDPVQKATSINVVDMSRTDMAKIKTMVESRSLEWDVANVNTLEIGRGAREGLWEKIDWSVVDPKAAGPIGKLDYGVVFFGFSMGLAYSKKTYPDAAKAPATWIDFWDVKKFPGPRALENRVRYQLEFALLADGVARDKLYPLDADRAFRKLDQIKPHITVWAKPPVQTVQLIADGEVVMAPAFNNEVANAQQRGVPIDLRFDGSLYLTNAWTILKGTPNLKDSMTFLKVATSPEYQARFAELTFFGPMHPDALPLIKDDVRRLLPTEPGNLARSVQFNNEWWAENEAKLIERWNKWIIQ